MEHAPYSTRNSHLSREGTDGTPVAAPVAAPAATACTAAPARAGTPANAAVPARSAAPFRVHTLAWALGVFLGVAALLFTIALSALPAPLPLVIGPAVIVDVRLVFVGTLLLAALALIVAAPFLRRRWERACEPAAPEPQSPRRPLAQRVGVGIATAFVLINMGAASLGALASWGLNTPSLLPEQSDRGARILVVTHSFLLLGSGSVYAVPAWSPIALPVGSFTTDDGYDPIWRGDYTLTWEGDTAHLALGTGAGGSYAQTIRVP